MNKNNLASTAKKLGKQTSATLTLPVLVYLILLMISGIGGHGVLNIFTGQALSSILTDAAYMTIVALGIGFQLKFGRFDFCGGALIVVSATIGGVVADAVSGGIVVLMLVSIITGIVLSVINASVYSWLKIPISVVSLAMAYLFEAIPGIVLGGDAGPGIMFMEGYKSLGLFPLILVPFAIACIIYFCYDKFTVVGRQSTLLARNQGAAVNIGINEKANTIVCYVISGLLFGLAGAVYATQNTLVVITTPLQTAGTLFSNIIPSLVGLFLSRFIDDTLGTFVGAFTISMLYFCLEAMGVLSGMRTIYYAVFLAIFIFVSGFWDQIIAFFKGIIGKINNKTMRKAPQS